MPEYGGDIQFVCLEAQVLAKKVSVFFVMQLGHRHCLATIAFILGI